MTALAELLAKAQKPAQDALRLYPLYKGKIQLCHAGGVYATSQIPSARLDD